MRTSILYATFFIAIPCVAAGCSGSAPDVSKSDLVGKSGEAQSPVASSTASAVTSPAAEAPRARQADAPEEEGPAPCTAEAECTNKCPPGAKGCTCATTPEGKACIPTCTADADCASLP